MLRPEFASLGLVGLECLRKNDHEVVLGTMAAE